MKLLVTGNIGYITTEFIKEAFPECQILLLGETALKSDRRKGISVHPMPHAEKEFEDTLHMLCTVPAFITSCMSPHSHLQIKYGEMESK